MIKKFELFESTSITNKKVDYYYLLDDLTNTKVRELFDLLKHNNYRAIATFSSKLECLSNFPLTKIAMVNYPIERTTLHRLTKDVQQCITNGANEIEFPWQAKYLDWSMDTWRNIVTNCMSNGVILRAMLEIGIEDPAYIKRTTSFLKNIGITHVTTSTGLVEQVGTLQDWNRFKTSIPSSFTVKACGNIQDVDTATKFLKAGVNLIGTTTIF